MSSVKSKSYILLQIKTLLENKCKYEHEINDFIEEHKNDKVYELLVIKNSLQKTDEEDFVSISENVLRNRF